jgi:hypothetical protein
LELERLPLLMLLNIALPLLNLHPKLLPMDVPRRVNVDDTDKEDEFMDNSSHEDDVFFIDNNIGLLLMMMVELT